MVVLLHVLQRLGVALYRQRFLVVVLLLAIIGAGAYFLWQGEAPQIAAALTPGDQPVPVTVASVQLLQSGPGAVVTLQETSGSRRIALNVGEGEAIAIAREKGMDVTGVPSDQIPATYDLLKSTIQTLGAKVDRAVVNSATQSGFQSEVVLISGQQTYTVKARPADAVALAMDAKAPIYVDDRVLQQFGAGGNG